MHLFVCGILQGVPKANFARERIQPWHYINLGYSYPTNIIKYANVCKFGSFVYLWINHAQRAERNHMKLTTEIKL